MVEAVFLDTQAFEAASFNFASPSFAALTKHRETGRLGLVLTDITVAEVRRRITEAVDREMKAHRTFRQQARVLKTAGLEVALNELDAAAIVKSLSDAFDAFLTNAEIISTREQEAGPVFEKYFTGAAPFGSTRDKKHEFPDAFVIQALIEWTESCQAELLVVSGDDLFREGCAACSALHAKVDLAAVLDHVASDDEKVATFIRAQLIARTEQVGDEAKRRFQDLDFSVEDEWGEVEVSVTNVTLNGGPEIIDITGKRASIQMTFTAEYVADVDSSTGIRESKDGHVLGREHVEESTSGAEELVVQVEITFNGTYPEAFKVTDVDLIEPTRGRRFRTSKYRWK